MGNESNKSSCLNVECKGKIIESKTLSECPNKPELAVGVAKIPAVIAEFTVQIDVESKIRLTEPVLEIKRIKKNIFLTQCRVIGKTHKVFLKGFVRKNIEYASVDSISKNAICGDVKHTTIHVPFQCITEVKDMKIVENDFSPSTKEITYYDEKNFGRDTNETDLISEEIFNEKLYCELVSAQIYEANIVEECQKVEYHPIEILFDTFVEKEVIRLSLRLLQNQEIKRVKPIYDKDYDEGK